jgi:DNA-binding SARP family transcriptional activator
LELQILGPLRVSVNGTTTVINGPQLRVLLVTLILRAGTIVSRDDLVDLVWRGNPPAAFATALRVHINQLRNLLEPDRPAHARSGVLLARQPGYVLTIERDQLDAHRFEDDVAAARSARQRGDLDGAVTALRRALDRWRGEPLREVDDLDLAEAAARRLQDLRSSAWILLAESELDRGHHTEIVPELQQLVAEDPLCERYSELLMLALYRGGRQADALRTMARIRHELVETLGVQPGAALERLELAILDHAPGLADPVGPAAGAIVVHDGPAAVPVPVPRSRSARAGLPRSLLVDPHDLIARDDEKARCLDAWATALGGRLQLLVVEGEPGVGKSRLLAEVARQVADDDAIVLHGRCEEDLPVPLRPFAEAIDDLLVRLPSHHADRLRALGGEPLERILPLTAARSIRRDPPVGAPSPDDAPGRAELDRYRLLDAVASLFAAVTEDAPALLILDDLQWADATSLRVLRHLAHQLDDRRMLVAASCRDDALTPRHPVASLLLDAKRTGILARLPLGGLSEQAVGTLLRDVAPDLEDATAARLTRSLHGLTEGNPFFAREVLAHLRHTATLDSLATGDLDVESIGLPMEVQVLLGRRMSQLQGGTLDLLRAGAVVGPQLDVDLLADVTGLSKAKVRMALDEAYEAGLLVDVPGRSDAFVFNHALFRHALYADLPPGRRARLHLRVGEAIETRMTHRHVPLSDLARHFSRAGTDAHDKALDYCERAGGEALAAAAYEDAVRHFEEALRVTARSGGGPGPRARLHLALGRARMAAADPVGARRSYSQAADLAARADDPVLLGEAALGYGSEWSLLGAADSSFMVLLDRAIAVVGAEHSRLRAYLLARRAMARYHRFGTPRAVRDSTSALDDARTAADPGALAAARHVEHEIHRVSYDGDTRLAIAREVVALGRQADDPARTLTGLTDAIADLLELGRTAEAEDTLADYERAARRIRRPVNLWMAAVLRAALASVRGPMDTLAERIDEAYAIGQEQRVEDALRVYAIGLFTLRWQQGRLAEVADLLGAFMASPAAEVTPGQWLLPRAMVELAAGHPDDARRTFATVLADVADLAEDSTWLGQLCLACELAWSLEDGAAAAALLDRLRPYAGRNVVIGPGAALFGPVDRSLALAAARCGRADEAGALIAAAGRAAEAMGSPPWRARVARDHARILALDAGLRDPNAEPGAGDRIAALRAEARRWGAEAGVAVDD